MSLPLLISGLSAVINLFFDRVFLGWYDLKHHMNASITAGLMWWTAQMLFNGIAGYVATFVAQYTGAKRDNRVGAILWQGIYACFFGALIVLALHPLLHLVLVAFYDDPLFIRLCSEYIWILSLGVFFLLFNCMMIGFFSTLGKTRYVIEVSILVTVVNIGLNYWFIFTPPAALPFIQAGVVGAAWATSISFLVGSFFFILLLIESGLHSRFHIKPWGALEPELFWRLIRFGLPSGSAHFVEVLTFTLFIMVLGKMDPIKLGAANMAFTVNNLVFVPLMSLSQAVTILVGTYIGAKKLRHAMRVPYLAILSGACTLTFVALSYVLIPGVYVEIFRDHGDSGLQNPQDFALMADQLRFYLIFMALYCFGDLFQLVLGGALRGAGDTTFCFQMTTLCSIFFIALPSYMALNHGWPDWSMFASIAIYVYVLTVAYLIRYKTGIWQSISMMEPEPAFLTKEFVP
jgi:MATE family multidrug resistance protein